MALFIAPGNSESLRRSATTSGMRLVERPSPTLPRLLMLDVPSLFKAYCSFFVRLDNSFRSVVRKAFSWGCLNRHGPLIPSQGEGSSGASLDVPEWWEEGNGGRWERMYSRRLLTMAESIAIPPSSGQGRRCCRALARRGAGSDDSRGPAPIQASARDGLLNSCGELARPHIPWLPGTVCARADAGLTA